MFVVPIDAEKNQKENNNTSQEIKIIVLEEPLTFSKGVNIFFIVNNIG